MSFPQRCLASEGGPLSRWARASGLNGKTGGSGIAVLDDDEARLEQRVPQWIR
jgi:hypothetical protein